MIDVVLSWLFLLAMGQGLFLAVVLLCTRQPGMRGANRLLATLLLVSVAIIGHAWLGLNGLYRQYPHSTLAIMTLGLLVGPLLYLYLARLLFGRPLDKRALLHALPFALATCAMLPFYLQAAEAKLAWMLARPAMPWYLSSAAAVKLVIFLFYIAACYRLVQRAPSSPLVQGLRRLMAIWLVGGVLSVAAFAIEHASVELPVSSDAIGGIALLLFVYATALLAMRLPLGYQPQLEAPAPPKPRYADSLLPEADRTRFLAALTACMENEHAYREGELKLEELAARLAMTPHELSQLINDACGANFQDYLNRYRVEALKSALHADAHAGDSILDLALASGFNSKSALNRAFKKHTGLTPSEFRRQKNAA